MAGYKHHPFDLQLVYRHPSHGAQEGEQEQEQQQQQETQLEQQYQEQGASHYSFWEY